MTSPSVQMQGNNFIRNSQYKNLHTYVLSCLKTYLHSPLFSNFSATSGAIEMTVNFNTWSLALINSTTCLCVAPSTFTSLLKNIILEYAL